MAYGSFPVYLSNYLAPSIDPPDFNPILRQQTVDGGERACFYAVVS